MIKLATLPAATEPAVSSMPMTCAPMIVAGAMANPAIALVLWKVLPESWVITCCAFGYTIAFLVVHFIGIPVVVSRCFHISLWKVYQPIGRPLVLALLALPVAIAFRVPLGLASPHISGVAIR